MTIWSELSEFNYLVTEYVHQRWQCFDFTEILEQQFHNCNNLYCCDFVLHTAHNSITLSTLKNIDTHSPVQLWWSTLCVCIYIYIYIGYRIVRFKVNIPINKIHPSFNQGSIYQLLLSLCVFPVALVRSL
jgi:hypothetical protein